MFCGAVPPPPTLDLKLENMAVAGITTPTTIEQEIYQHVALIVLKVLTVLRLETLKL